MLTGRQQSILNIFLETPAETKSVSDFSSFELDRTTVFRDLKKMVENEILIPDGKAYRLNQASDAYMTWDLSRPPHQRQPVRYEGFNKAECQSP